MLNTSPDIILPETLDLLFQIQKDETYKDFFLVGGTALALYLGHRLSVDLDFFTITTFDNEKIEASLLKHFDFSTDYVAENTLKGFARGVKLDFITHAYPLVKPLFKSDGLVLSSMQDIGAMKLNAISHSGNRQKDFYDLYFLLEHFSLSTLLDAYRFKYANSNPIIPLKAIIWFEDIDFEIEKPMLNRRISFDEVKTRLVKSTKYPDRIF